MFVFLIKKLIIILIHITITDCGKHSTLIFMKDALKKKNKINNDYIDILDKDFNINLLEKHKENIYSLIEKSIDIIIFKDKNKKTKEYLFQILIILYFYILLMLSSIFIYNVYFSMKEKNSKKIRILYQNVCIFVIN